MSYFWYIPLAICAGLLVLGVYLRLQRRARKAAGDESKSPLELAQDMERNEEAAERQKEIPAEARKKAA